MEIKDAEKILEEANEKLRQVEDICNRNMAIEASVKQRILENDKKLEADRAKLSIEIKKYEDINKSLTDELLKQGQLTKEINDKTNKLNALVDASKAELETKTNEAEKAVALRMELEERLKELKDRLDKAENDIKNAQEKEATNLDKEKKNQQYYESLLEKESELNDREIKIKKSEKLIAYESKKLKLKE